MLNPELRPVCLIPPPCLELCLTEDSPIHTGSLHIPIFLDRKVAQPSSSLDSTENLNALSNILQDDRSQKAKSPEQCVCLGLWRLLKGVSG